MEQDLFLLYTYFLLIIHFPNTHWHLLCVQLVLGDLDRKKKKQAQPGLLLQLTSRVNTEVRKAPIVNLPTSGANSWERPGLRTQK